MVKMSAYSVDRRKKPLRKKFCCL